MGNVSLMEEKKNTHRALVGTFERKERIEDIR
jgi:hypothetical protein